MPNEVKEDLSHGYAYDYSALSPLALQQGLPREELPSLEWLGKVLLVALKIVGNELIDDEEKKELALAIASHAGNPRANEFVDLIRSIWDRLNAATPAARPRELADYKALFQTIPLPPSANVLFDDDAFAHWRVGGPNPTVIRRATDADALTNDGLRSVPSFANDDLDALIASGRLVVADYRGPLADLENGMNGNVQKFAYKPIAWFAAPANSPRLMPVAILPGDGEQLLYAPGAAQSWEWNAAKTIVSSADTNHHELIAHLGRTHLFVEPFIVATHLALRREHPVSLLLVPHFEGTIFINWAAVKFLIGNGGAVDQLLAGTIESSRTVAVESLTGMTFDDAMVPHALAGRGFGADVPFAFPYLTDALAVWGATRDWIASYLAIFYKNDAAVQNDGALQSWAQLVRSQEGGRVASFPELQSIDTLVDALCAIIFTASSQHAAVNFPQATVMSYTPTLPGAGWAAVSDAIGSQSESQWLDVLPPMDMAALQLRLTSALGGVHYTRLGDYRLLHFIRSGHYHKIHERLATFHHALSTIEATIHARNAGLSPAFQYPYLLPSQIPQSINI